MSIKKHPCKPSGSILIWTILLGLTLTTVFFYFSQRLNLTVALQRKSIEEQNAMLLLESYANYLEGLDAGMLKAMEGEINFQDGLIGGKLERDSNMLMGALDVGEIVEYELDGKAKLEWGLCENAELDRPLQITPQTTVSTGNCGSYDGLAEVTGPLLTLQATHAPLNYRLTAYDGSTLENTTWHMNLEIILENKKKLSLERTFASLL